MPAIRAGSLDVETVTERTYREGDGASPFQGGKSC
jgi:hypothetical protein